MRKGRPLLSPLFHILLALILSQSNKAEERNKKDINGKGRNQMTST
jgi:hypothetical protein